MFRLLFARRADWAAFTVACVLSLTLMSLGRGPQARAVARSLDRLGGSLTIDKGEKDGILPNRAVLTPDGLVGRVDRSTSHEARVLTLLHRDCSVAVRVGRSRVDGVVQWEFGDRPMLSLLYVSAREDVQAGDDVLTSGLGGIFPEGVRVGSVTKVNVAENGLMKEVQVRPAVNFRSLEDVLIYMPGGAGLGPRMPAVESDVPDSVTQAPVPKPVPKVFAPKTAVPYTSVSTTPVP